MTQLKMKSYQNVFAHERLFVPQLLCVTARLCAKLQNDLTTNG